MAKFIRRIRDLHGFIRVIVVAGIVHEDATARTALTKDGVMRTLVGRSNLTLITLCTSSAKFTTSGLNGTADRLFNTF